MPDPDAGLSEGIAADQVLCKWLQHNKKRKFSRVARALQKKEYTSGRSFAPVHEQQTDTNSYNL